MTTLRPINQSPNQHQPHNSKSDQPNTQNGTATASKKKTKRTTALAEIIKTNQIDIAALQEVRPF
jgi:hypothetical protein